MNIGGLQQLTLIDFPGRVAATVFLTGCNFRCPFCYSSDIVLPDKIKKHPVISQEEFFDFLKERKGFLEGVVICGGEPTLNEDLPDFIDRIRQLGLLVKLDTNGTNFDMLRELIDSKKLDYVAMDIKGPKDKYRLMTGLSADRWNKGLMENVEKSVELLKSSDVEFEFRTTVVPTLLDKEDILEIVRWIKPAPRYFLQGFRAGNNINPDFNSVKPYPQEYLLEIRKAAAPFFNVCRVR